MKGQGKEIIQRFLAILVIVAMLAVMGIPPPVIFFFAIVTYFIWRAVRRTEQQEALQVFNFYVDASEILRDEERRWFGFEVSEVIDHGENVLRLMHDPPPLVYFTLGALYHRLNDHAAAAEHLTYVVENDLGEEHRRLKPSPELRRYVQTLRRLEREPGEAPQTLAALRYLGRLRRHQAAIMLAESRERLHEANAAPAPAHQLGAPAAGHHHQQPLHAKEGPVTLDARRHTPPPPPPPIADVLRDLYEEEKKTA